MTRPIAIVNAPKVKILSDTLLNFSAISAIKIDNGIETIDIAVVLIFLKNNKITIIATMVPNAAFSIIVYNESSIGLAVSIVFVALISLLFLTNSSIFFCVALAT